EGVLTELDFRQLIARLDADVASKTVAVAAVSSQRLDAASTLLGTHGLRNSLRTLDAIHLATAQALHARSRVAAFVAADKKLLAVAGAVGGFTVMDVS